MQESIHFVSNWVKSSNLPLALSDSQTIVVKDKVYLLGGRNSEGGAVSTIYSANLDSNGTLGNWISAGNLPIPLTGSQAIVNNFKVYMLGGWSGLNGYVSKIYSAIINTDGTLGSWALSGNLPIELAASQAVVIKDKVYMLGGIVYDNRAFNIHDTSSSNIYSADINNKGELGPWTLAGNLPQDLSFSQAVVIKNKVYMLGGTTDNGCISDIYSAIINSDGTLSTWTKSGNLPVELYKSKALIIKDRIYLLGGYSNRSWISTIYSANINTDGTLGFWSKTGNLPEPLGESQAIVVKNKIYMLGGRSDKGHISDVYTASVVY